MFPITDEELYEDGQIVFDEGDPGDKVYVVQSGAVAIYKMVMGEQLVVEVMRCEEVFGEMAFVTGMPRSATARAMGKAVVGVVDARVLREEFKSLSPGMRKMFTSMAFRLKKTTDTSTGVTYIRKFPRVLRTFSLKFQNGDDWLSGYTQDASCGGLFIKTKKPLHRGVNFILELALPNEPKPLSIRCEVVWARMESENEKEMPLGMGVKFLNISKADYEKLRVYIPEC
ncbi:MAG: cyclic nucleotide-binding domain-containing protein [Proteobacteria bacterium]|nr:cyclic nucleotide-binding domain-containing protein [Pseudomonadota bacterium]